MWDLQSIPLSSRRSLLARALAALPLLAALGRTTKALAATTIPFGTTLFTTPFTTHPFTTLFTFPFTTHPFTNPFTTNPFTNPNGGGGASNVPEPATGLLLGSGVAALAAAAYSRGIRDNLRRLLERWADTGSHRNDT